MPAEMISMIGRMNAVSRRAEPFSVVHDLLLVRVIGRSLVTNKQPKKGRFGNHPWGFLGKYHAARRLECQRGREKNGVTLFRGFLSTPSKRDKGGEVERRFVR